MKHDTSPESAEKSPPASSAVGDGPGPWIAAGCRVTLHFALAFPNGDIIDSNFERTPASFTLGDGSLLPGFESLLLGLGEGAKGEAVLPPTEAFGEPNPGNVHYLPRSRFARFLPDEYAELRPGSVVSFADAAGFDLPGVVKTIDPQGAEVDFNHPLAGRDIVFRFHILQIIPADTQVVSIRV